MPSLWQIAYVIALAVMVYCFIRSLQEYHKHRNFLSVMLAVIALILITELWSRAYGDRFGRLLETYRFLVLLIPLGAFLAYQYWEELRYKGEKEKKYLREMFEKYLNPHVVSRLLETDFSLGGKKQEVTVMVTDVRGSTKMCIEHEPETVVSALNEYFEATNSTVLESGGMIDKITGDGVMALYNAPLPMKNHTLKAMDTAVALQKKMRELNAKLKKKNLPHLRVGMGIDVGEGVIGNIGSKHLARYTVIGDVANTASRVQGYADEGEIAVTEKVYSILKGQFKFEGPYAVSPKGKGTMKIYKVVVK